MRVYTQKIYSIYIDRKVYLSPGPYVDVLYQSMTIVFIFRDNSFSKFSGNCRGLPLEISEAVENSLSTLVLPCLQCKEYLTDRKDCLKCTNSEREIFSPLSHEFSQHCGEIKAPQTQPSMAVQACHCSQTVSIRQTT